MLKLLLILYFLSEIILIVAAHYNTEVRNSTIQKVEKMLDNFKTNKLDVWDLICPITAILMVLLC